MIQLSCSLIRQKLDRFALNEIIIVTVVQPAFSSLKRVLRNS